MLILLQTSIEDGTNLVDRDESHPLNLYQRFEKKKNANIVAQRFNNQKSHCESSKIMKTRRKDMKYQINTRSTNRDRTTTQEDNKEEHDEDSYRHRKKPRKNEKKAVTLNDDNTVEDTTVGNEEIQENHDSKEMKN